MYGKEGVGLFLLALKDGMGVSGAAAFAGVKRERRPQLSRRPAPPQLHGGALGLVESGEQAMRGDRWRSSYQRNRSRFRFGFEFHDDILRVFDESMPEGERLGDFLDSVEIPASELASDDKVWAQGIDGRYILYPVVGLMDDGTPLVGRYDHDGDWSWNPNNRMTAETVRITPRGQRSGRWGNLSQRLMRVSCFGSACAPVP